MVIATPKWPDKDRFNCSTSLVNLSKQTLMTILIHFHESQDVTIREIVAIRVRKFLRVLHTNHETAFMLQSKFTCWNVADYYTVKLLIYAPC